MQQKAPLWANSEESLSGGFGGAGGRSPLAARALLETASRWKTQGLLRWITPVFGADDDYTDILGRDNGGRE